MSCTFRALNVAIVSFLLLLQSAKAANYYVSPNGTGNGTLANPGSLLTACSHTGWAAAITGDDTIWLRGGTYSNSVFFVTNFWSYKVEFGGSLGHPVTWRSYSNEWAVVDGSWDFGTKYYHRFRDIEFFDSHKSTHVRTGYEAQDGPYLHFMVAGNGGAGAFEYINCVIHDVRDCWGGGGAWSVRGCVFWNIGQNGYEHVTYSASKYFEGNIVGWTWGTVVNFVGANGAILSSNIMFGARCGYLSIANTDVTVCGNRLYGDFVNQGWVNMLAARNGNKVITNNTFIGDGGTAVIGNNPTLDFRWNVVMMNNPAAAWPVLQNHVGTSTSWTVDYNQYYARTPQPVVFRDITSGGEQNMNFSQWRAKYPAFDAHSTAPGGLPADAVHVYPNADQAKRAHIAVYNWTRKDNVAVDVSNVLRANDTYRLYSAQNYKAGPIRAGTYTGSPISIPMTNLNVAPLLYSTNGPQPKPMNPEFGAFVLIGANGGQVAPPTNLRVVGQ